MVEIDFEGKVYELRERTYDDFIWVVKVSSLKTSCFDVEDKESVVGLECFERRRVRTALTRVRGVIGREGSVAHGGGGMKVERLREALKKKETETD